MSYAKHKKDILAAFLQRLGSKGETQRIKYLNKLPLDLPKITELNFKNISFRDIKDIPKRSKDTSKVTDLEIEKVSN